MVQSNSMAEQPVEPASTPSIRTAYPEPFLELVRRQYMNLYRLAYARFGQPEAARQASLQILAAAEQRLPRQVSSSPTNAGQKALLPDDYWLYEIALPLLPHRPSPIPSGPEPSGFWNAVNALDDQEHLLLVLRYLLGWEARPSARLIHVGEGAVLAQLRLFREQLAAGLSAPAPGGTRLAPDTLLERALQARYPAPEVSAEEMEALASQAHQIASGASSQREVGTGPTPTAAPAPRLAVPVLPGAIALLAALCLLAIAGLAGFALASEAAPRLAQPSPTLAGNLPTPITPAPRLAALTRRASTAQILQRWKDSPGLWRTAAMDVQSADYGPPSYSGPPRNYRYQAWISQPGEGFELFGLLSGSPTQVLLTTGDRQFRRDLLAGQTRETRWDGYAVSLLSRAHLRWMIYPLSSPWVDRAGSFRPVQTTNLLERSSLVFDWLNPDGLREARFWLDAETGLILRLQEYGGPDFQTLLVDSVAVYFTLDKAAPPAEMSAAARASEQLERLQGLQSIPLTPTPAVTRAPRPTQPPEPAPVGFDPQGTHLIFELADRPSPLDVYTQTQNANFNLFADGYQLARLRFGLPWGLRCTRSPNGLYLAFNNATDGALPADDQLRWLDLREPAKVYKTESGLLATDFAFSPQSDRLAAFSAAGYGEAGPGIYMLSLLSGEVSLVLPAAEASSLAWSPDGEYLAFAGRLPEDEAPSLILIHLRSRTVNYQSQPGAPLDEAYNDSPMLLWNTPFPVPMGGMEACAIP